MKLFNNNSLILLIMIMLASNSAVARGYGYAYVPPFHYPPPPPVYGYPYYPSFWSRPAEQHQSDSTKIVTRPDQKAPAEIPDAKSQITISSSEKKQKFIELLLPHIDKENEKILADRYWLEKLSSKLENRGMPSHQEIEKLGKLAQSYEIETDTSSTLALTQQLLKHVDLIPASLTLAQAANETGWGTSRFATQANNYFGIWTYEADKGLKPRERDTDKKHYVRKFDSPGESVRYYMKLLNTHPAYEELRNIRASLRRNNRKVSGTQLAQGLEKYSAKGNEYIKLITLLIAQNQWAQLDTTQTASS